MMVSHPCLKIGPSNLRSEGGLAQVVRLRHYESLLVKGFEFKSYKMWVNIFLFVCVCFDSVDNAPVWVTLFIVQIRVEYWCRWPYYAGTQIQYTVIAIYN